jgi:hypothetical protein
VRRFVLLTFALFGCSLEKGGLGARESFDAEIVDSALVEDTAEIAEEPPASDSAVPIDGEPADSASIDSEILTDTGTLTEGGVMLTGCAPASFGGHDYLFCERDANWDQAHTTCLFAGLDLVVIGDETENDFITKAISPAKSGSFYIGLNDQAKEGDYTWVDGSKLGYKNWGLLEPNDFFGEDCSIIKKDGSWNDVDCVDSPANAFICEAK